MSNKSDVEGTQDDPPCGPFLVCHRRHDADMVFNLAGHRTATLGRSDECDFSFNDKSISRVHATVKMVDGDWTIKDMRSTYGTYLSDGSPLRERSILRSGAKLRLGRRVKIDFVAGAQLLALLNSFSDAPKSAVEADETGDFTDRTI